MSGTVLSRRVVRLVRHEQAGGWLAWLVSALRAMETRRSLAQMDDRMLKDIGLTRSEALEEAGRAPWDLGPASPHAPWVMR